MPRLLTVDGIGRFFRKDVLGISCSLWNLPFDDDTFTVVCSHLGIDECREIPTVLNEAVRVLKKGGCLVLCCRNSGYIRHRRLFDLYNINEGEAVSYLREVRLYAGLSQLDEILLNLGLIRTGLKNFDGGRFVVKYVK